MADCSLSPQSFIDLLQSGSLSLADPAAIDEIGRLVVAALLRELMAPLLTELFSGGCGNCAAICDDNRDADQGFANSSRQFYQAFACRNQLAQVQKVVNGDGWETATPNIDPELCQLGTLVMSRAIQDFYMSDAYVVQLVGEFMDLRVHYVKVALRKLVIETRERNTMLHKFRISDYAGLDDRYRELDIEQDDLLAQVKVLDSELRTINAEIQEKIVVMTKSSIEAVLTRISYDLNFDLLSAQSETNDLLITRFRAVLVESFHKWLESLEKQVKGARVGERFCVLM